MANILSVWYFLMIQYEAVILQDKIFLIKQAGLILAISPIRASRRLLVEVAADFQPFLPGKLDSCSAISSILCLE